MKLIRQSNHPHNPLLVLTIMLVASLATSLAAAAAATVRVPTVYSGTDGGANAGSSLLRSVIRLQEVHAASQFPSQPITITELRFRPSAVYGAAFSTVISNLEINISTTPRAPHGLSSAFASNIGSNTVVAFAGTATVSSTFTGPANGPKDFDIRIPLTTPVNYDSSKGNLLIDYRNFSGSGATYLDSGAAASAGRAFAMNASASNATTVDDGSEVVEIVYAVETNGVPTTTNAQGLVSLWHANGNAQDSVGTNHGALVGNVTFTSGVNGQAFQFNGSGFIRVSNSASLRSVDGLTMALWFLRNDGASSSYTLFDKRDWTTCDFGASIPDYGLVQYFNDPGYYDFEKLVTPRPVGGTWHYFVGTYRQTPTGVEMVSYIDGVSVGTTTAPGTLASAGNTMPLAIGAARDGASDYFVGLIDEVALYNYALSASEVAASYGGATPPLTIISQPQSVTVYAGDTATFSVGAVGTAPLGYQWHFNNGAISGATSATLTISNIQASDVGSYFAVVSDASGSATSAVTTVTIAMPPTNTPPGMVSLWHGDGDAQDALGHNHGVMVGGGGYATGVSGQAFRLDGTNFIHIDDSASLHLTNALTVTMWFLRSGSPYSDTLFDKRDWTTCNYGASLPGYGVVLYYNDPRYYDFEKLVVYQRPSAGVWHHFAASFRQRNNGVEVIYYLNGVAVATNTTPGTLAAAANNAPLAIGADRDGASPTGYFQGLIDEVALYNYALSASEVAASYGGATPPLTIISQPQSVTVYAGDTATFSVGAVGTAPLGYQWHFNNGAISGATSATLTISNIQASDVGSYFAVVSDASGSATSAVATLSIRQAPAVGGTVIFANNSSAFVYDVDGTNRLSAGSYYRVQLYAGTGSNSLTAVNFPINIGPLNGYFSGGTVVITQVPPGTLAWLQVKVWESAFGSTFEEAVVSGGKFGESVVFATMTGGAGMPPSLPGRLVPPMASFSLHPPNEAPLAAENGAKVNVRNRTSSQQVVINFAVQTGSRYTVESSSDLLVWLPVMTTNAVGTVIRITEPSTRKFEKRFYRARPSVE